MKTRRSITILALVVSLALLVGITVSGTTAAQETEIAFTIDGPTELEVGDEATYTVRVAAPTELYSAEILIDYPVDAASVTAVENGALLSQDTGSLIAAAGADDGVITYAESRTSTQNGTIGEGILLSFTIEITESGTHQFAFLDAQARDPDINPIATSTEDLTIQVADRGLEDSENNTTSVSDSESSPESTGDNGDDTKDTQTKDSKRWSPVVDETVQNALKDSETVRVMATTTQPEELADRIHERSGEDTTALPMASVVAFTGDAELIRWVAGNDRVTRIQDDEAATTQPLVTVEKLTLEPNETEIDTPVTVEATLRNDAAVNRTKDITLTVEGTVLEERTVALDDNTIKTVVFTFTPEEPGEYTVGISDSTTTTLFVSESIGNATLTEEQAGTEPTDDDTPGFTATLTLIALSAVSLILRRPIHSN